MKTCLQVGEKKQSRSLQPARLGGETTGGKKTMKRKGKVLSCRKIKDTTDKL